MSDVKPKGSIIGGALLIAGCCIGAGMLALPIQTGIAGFFPSLSVFLLAWIYMTLTGLLLVEVNGWFSTRVNLISMVDKTLGKVGKAVCWIFYLFLFYSLLVAYISGSGSLVATIFKLKTPLWIGSLFFVIIFGLVVYRGTKTVDLWNRVLMFGKILAFLAIIFLGVSHVNPDYLVHEEPKYIFFSLPVLIISFGFHNLVPSITAYFGGDVKRVRKTIFLGSGFVLIVYLIWQLIVLGIVPVEGKDGLIDSYHKDQEASQALMAVLGVSWVGVFAQFLAFFAILTSFLAQALSVTHFLGDGLKIKYKEKENPWLCVLALAPPCLLSIIYPQLFFKALNFAGGFCAIVLFGVLPVLMTWIGRYRLALISPYTLKGGKTLLVLIFLFSLFIIFYQLTTMFGLMLFPHP